jgi:hypothetical protein
MLGILEYLHNSAINSTGLSFNGDDVKKAVLRLKGTSIYFRKVKLNSLSFIKAIDVV